MNIKIKKAYSTLLAQETGAIRKEPGGRIKIALAYPNTYRVGMSNLGLHTMYSIFNKRQDTLCERVFLPSRDLEPLYTGTPAPLSSLESMRPVREFDILAFSCSFENDYINCLKMMDLAGLPLWAENRDETHPFVIMGGPCTFFNVEPMAPFIDCFICGEGEVLGNQFLDRFRAWIEAGGKKHDLLLGLLGTEGIYCPKFYEYIYDNSGRICELVVYNDAPRHICPRIEENIDLFNTSTTIFSRDTEFGHMYLLEVSRGCPRQCSYCLLSRIYKPFRQRSLQNLLSSVKEGLTHRSRIGLVGASLTDYEDLIGLCEGIISAGGDISLCSLRADDLSDQLMECLTKSGIQTITLAPEAGKQGLRSRIGKGDITDEKIMNGVERLIKWKVPHLKLYFMVGLPNETLEDIRAIIKLVKRIRHHAIQISKGKGALRQITISISSFVPKPLTRFQFYPMEPVELLNRKIRYLKRESRSLKGVNCVHDLPKWSFVQALLSRGDRRVGEIMYLAFLENGNWNKVFRQFNINPEFYLSRQIKEGDILPWGLWANQKSAIDQT